MGSTQNARDVETAGIRARVIDAISGSVLLKIAMAGVLLFVSGWLLDVGINEGVLAAIFAVWGVGLMLVGLSGYGFIWWRRQ